MGNCQNTTPSGAYQPNQFRGQITIDSERGAMRRMDDAVGIVSTTSPELEDDLARIREQYRGIRPSTLASADDIIIGTYEQVNAQERLWQERMDAGFELHGLSRCRSL